MILTYLQLNEKKNLKYILQGSTIRKRKIYEDFLSKVSILGKLLVSGLFLFEFICVFWFLEYDLSILAEYFF